MSYELVSYILAGLGSKFDPIINSITTWLEPMTLREVYSHLLSYELRLEQHHLSLDLTSASAILPLAVVLVVVTLMGHQGVWIIRAFKPAPIRNGPHTHGPRGLGVGSNSYGPRPVCQVCNWPGHTALQCYPHIDHVYQGYRPNNFQSFMSAAPPFTDQTRDPDIILTLTLAIWTFMRMTMWVMINGNGAGLPISHIRASHIFSPSKSFTLQNLLHVSSI